MMVFCCVENDVHTLLSAKAIRNTAAPVRVCSHPYVAPHGGQVAPGCRFPQTRPQHNVVQTHHQAIPAKQNASQKQADEQGGGGNADGFREGEEDNGEDGGGGCHERGQKEEDCGGQGIGAGACHGGGCAANNAQEHEAEGHHTAELPGALPGGAGKQLGAPAKGYGVSGRIGGDDGRRAEEHLQDCAAQDRRGHRQEVGKL